MASIQHLINNIPLDSQYATVQQGTGYLAAVNVSRPALTAAYRQGSIPNPLTPQFEERTISVILNAWGGRFAEETSRILRAATMPQITLGRTVNGVTQECRAELVGVSESDNDLPHVEPLTLTFAIPGVWWRSTSTMQRTLDANESNQLLLPAAGEAITTSTGYWTRWEGEENNSTSALADFVTMWEGAENDSASVLYDELPEGFFGDAPIPDMVFRLPVNVTYASVTDPLSGTGVSWQGSASSSYTYVDAGSLTAWRSTSDSAWTGGTTVKGVDYPARGPLQAFPQMDGSYTLSAEIVGADSGATITANFKLSWW